MKNKKMTLEEIEGEIFMEVAIIRTDILTKLGEFSGPLSEIPVKWRDASIRDIADFIKFSQSRSIKTLVNMELDSIVCEYFLTKEFYRLVDLYEKHKTSRD